MKTRPIITVLAAGASLTIGACGGRSSEPTSNPPPMPVEPENPPAPTEVEIPTANPPPPTPTWDEVPSQHPEGATNPPIPHLYVTPEGECYKDWVSPFIAPGPDGRRDRVRTDCATEDCGTLIVCPEDRAQALLDAYKEAQEAGSDADSE